MTDETEATIRAYEEHVNAPLASLLKFMGLGAVEERAEGCWVYDSEGNAYLDCLGGFGVFSLGHRNLQVVAAVQQQLVRMPLSSKILFNRQQALLAERLAEIAPGDLKHAFFCNSGTEAVEGCLKLARAATRRIKIVSAQGAFHGKTLGSLSASGRDLYKRPFEPLLTGFVQVPFGDADALAQAVDSDTAAVILEPIQGEAGVIIPPDTYLPAARQICDRTGALLILDEVQTGLGRTGKMLACEHTNTAPDLMALGKALGGGVMPIGAFLGTPKTWQVFEENPLIHSSTFGGNPLACAAGLAALDEIQAQDLPARSAESGAWLLEQLRELHSRYAHLIPDLRGKGLMLGVEFVDADVGALVIAGLVARRVLAAYTLNNPRVLRLEPPLIISRSELETAVKALAASLAAAGEMVHEVEGE